MPPQNKVYVSEDLAFFEVSPQNKVFISEWPPQNKGFVRHSLLTAETWQNASAEQ
jgi:hypothetical protein